MTQSAAERPRQSVKKACHCEPVRAAKQVPLGYTLAWQSVSKAPDFCVFSLISCKGITDSHTSDIGHWFGMTGVGFIDTLKARPKGRAFSCCGCCNARRISV